MAGGSSIHDGKIGSMKTTGRGSGGRDTPLCLRGLRCRALVPVILSIDGEEGRGSMIAAQKVVTYWRAFGCAGFSKAERALIDHVFIEGWYRPHFILGRHKVKPVLINASMLARIMPFHRVTSARRAGEPEARGRAGAR
jgi:hypothetical protein